MKSVFAIFIASIVVLKSSSQPSIRFDRNRIYNFKVQLDQPIIIFNTSVNHENMNELRYRVLESNYYEPISYIYIYKNLLPSLKQVKQLLLQ